MLAFRGSIIAILEELRWKRGKIGFVWASGLVSSEHGLALTLVIILVLRSMERLLPELLFQIFDFAVHTPGDPDPSFPPRPPSLSELDVNGFEFCTDKKFPDFPTGISAHVANTHSPVDLSHVCRKWRSLTFAESKLWSTIYVTNGRPGFPQLLELWLANSRSQPLSLVFRDGTDHGEGDGEVVGAMVAQAVSHHQRWSSFKIRSRRVPIPLRSIAESITPSIQLPNLNVLAFSFNATEGDPDPGESEIDMFDAVWGRLVKGSPQLVELQMWATMDYDLAFQRLLPFSRLTVITLPMVWVEAASSFVQCLRRCASLHTLSLSLLWCEPQPGETYSIAIPSLRHLEVICTDTTIDLVAFIQTFHFPFLSTLSLHLKSYAFVDDPGTAYNWLKSALDHWKPPLRSLSLRDEAAFKFEDYCLPLLHHPTLQNLIEVKLGGVAGTALLKAMSVDPHQPDLAPMRKLQHIQFESAYLDLDSTSVTNLALSRRAGLSADLLSLNMGFICEEDMELQVGSWDACPDVRLRTVERSFRPVEGPVLDREFMVRDFSMIQDWPIHRDQD